MNVWYNNKCSRIAPEISYNKNNQVASGILKLLNACAMSQIILNPRMEGLCTYVHTHTVSLRGEGVNFYYNLS